MIEHFEKGYSPSALQRKYKLTYEQARELAEELKKLKEERNALAMGSFPMMIEAAKKTDQLRQQLDIAVKALKSLRKEQTVVDMATGDVYYIWDYALKQIKELEK